MTLKIFFLLKFSTSDLKKKILIQNLVFYRLQINQLINNYS